MSDIETTLVRHCPYAFGVSFTHVNGWKVTYSGDTMPCDSLVKLGLYIIYLSHLLHRHQINEHYILL